MNSMGCNEGREEIRCKLNEDVEMDDTERQDQIWVRVSVVASASRRDRKTIEVVFGMFKDDHLNMPAGR